MGQKVNPISLRVGINRTTDSRWYAEPKDYAENLRKDLEIKKFLKKKLENASVSKIIVERPAKKATVTIHSAKPGIIIGKKGADIEVLKRGIRRLTGDDVNVNIVEVRKPEIDANLVAEAVAQQIERRVSYRRAMKRAISSALRLGAEGIKVTCGGRLGGAEIARSEWYREGRVPLHTLRADIDYGTAEALTTYGIIGIKVWIYKGDIMEHDPMAQERKANQN